MFIATFNPIGHIESLAQVLQLHYALIECIGTQAFLVEKIESWGRKETSPKEGNKDLCGSEQDAERMVSFITWHCLFLLYFNHWDYLYISVR